MLFLVRVLAFLSMFRDQAYAFDPSFVRLVNDAITVLSPPVRISAHLCRLEQGDAVALSRIMSREGLAHEIHRELEDFEARIHDTWEHRVLYVLDLDCDYAVPLLRAANASGMFRAPIRWLLLRDVATPGNSTDEIEATFKDMAVYPDSEVILAERSESDDGFTRIESVYRPSPYHGIVVENRGNWTSDRGIRMANLDATSRRRRNLRRTPLKSCLVMTDPDTINHLTDYENKHIDPTTKANYPWMLHITSRMNATISFRVTNSWGYRRENGSWDGMTGMLQRREIDIGGTGSFFISQRIGVVDFVQLYTKTDTCFVFRKPLLSTVSNIFTLPFQRSVWVAIGIFLSVVLVLLFFSSKWEYRRSSKGSNDPYWQQFNLAEQTLSDNFMVVLGAIAQQGYSYEPYRIPSRVVTLMLLIAALNLYASYTANIVALLQSTTESIKTPADLLHSPLKLGAQDTVYFRYYFKNFQDPIRKAIVEQKIEPKGMNASYMTTQEGVARIRNELFAFYGERGSLYKFMQETYQEEEKCGMMEIEMLNVLYPTLVIQTRSPYLEIVKNAALLLHETGLKFRDEYRLFTKKPKCHGRTNFIRIGFTECYFALVSMGYGTFLSLLVLMAELLWHNKCKSIDFRTTTRFASSVVAIRSETLEKSVAALNGNADSQEHVEEIDRFSSEAMEGRLANVDHDRRQGDSSTIGFNENV